MGVHRTCGEPDEIELTPMGVKLNGTRRIRPGPPRWRRPRSRTRCLPAEKSGNIFRVGIFLDFVRRSGTTRTPRGAYVRRAKRNRIVRHRGEIERLTARTPEGVVEHEVAARRLLDEDPLRLPKAVQYCACERPRSAQPQANGCQPCVLRLLGRARQGPVLGIGRRSSGVGAVMLRKAKKTPFVRLACALPPRPDYLLAVVLAHVVVPARAPAGRASPVS